MDLILTLGQHSVDLKWFVWQPCWTKKYRAHRIHPECRFSTARNQVRGSKRSMTHIHLLRMQRALPHRQQTLNTKMLVVFRTLPSYDSRTRHNRIRTCARGFCTGPAEPAASIFCGLVCVVVTYAHAPSGRLRCVGGRLGWHALRLVWACVFFALLPEICPGITVVNINKFYHKWWVGETSFLYIFYIYRWIHDITQNKWYIWFSLCLLRFLAYL